MGTTPKYGWPYPELTSDPPDGPAQIKALAMSIENTLVTGGVKAARGRFAAGGPQLYVGATYAKYPLVTAYDATCGHLSNGAVVIDIAGIYVVEARVACQTNEAATVIAAGYCEVRTADASWSIQAGGRGCGPAAYTIHAVGLIEATAGMSLELRIAGYSYAANAGSGSGYVDLVRAGSA